MKKTHQQKILALLSDGKWHSIRELNAICFDYRKRLSELKQKYGIEKEIMRDAHGLNWYKLNQITFFSNCCDAEIDNPDSNGHGKCSRCGENTVPYVQDLL